MVILASYKLVFLLFVSFLCYSITEADPTYLYHNCSIHNNFTAGSAYQDARSRLLYYLFSNATFDTEFYKTTVAGSSDYFYKIDGNPSDSDSDAIYGLFMCRGGVTSQECLQCVGYSTQRLPDECPFSKEAIIWYDECLLRYSNRSFFSTVDTRPRLGLLNTGDVSDQANFMRLLLKTINETADEAAEGELGKKKYATKQANISGFQSLYCLAQCTPDLSPQDCRRCLSGVIGDFNWCCVGKQGGRVLYPSCNARYELYTQTSAPSPTTTVPLADPQGKRKDQSPKTFVVVVVVLLSIVVATILSCFTFCFLRKKLRKGYKGALQNYFGSESTTLESLQFSFATIEAATNKFSLDNKIGKGGFGEVYKGILSDGREIAVKRLSRSSGQGVIEFKNEILLIAKLQHRNLVALLGFCLEEQEKILVYEYVPNNSLDYFLFGSQKRRVLNWAERYKIIGGVARGILYLHEYSRLKVIHRDLKPSNILLDNDMNAKISDFGLAKMVAIDETEGSTNRIVGTYGYMSPEYAMFGQFSEKSDVFSFGVIVLEIISGKKNTGCHGLQNVDGLLSYAWKQWREEKWLEILDSNMIELESYNSEVIKCIKIGLLCVQENPEVRPSMNTVVQYLSNDSIHLPFPQEPAFFLHGRMEPTSGGTASRFGQHSYNSKPCSINEMSLTNFFPR